MSTKFSINLNKFALLRNSREGNKPDVLSVAARCVARGVHGLTVHPRPDQRHARYADVFDLARLVSAHPAVELNVEGNPVDEFMEVVCKARPHQVTLVPDAAAQLTSDHGWDVRGDDGRLKTVVERLKSFGIRVSVFLDPDLVQVDAVAGIGADRIELYTESYARAFATPMQDPVLEGFAAAAARATARGMGVNAGHDLDQKNLGPFLRAVRGVAEVSIGHAVVCESLDAGLEPTLDRYLALVGC